MSDVQITAYNIFLHILLGSYSVRTERLVTVDAVVTCKTKL